MRDPERNMMEITLTANIRFPEDVPDPPRPRLVLLGGGTVAPKEFNVENGYSATDDLCIKAGCFNFVPYHLNMLL